MPNLTVQTPSKISVVRTAAAAILVALGIVWLVLYRTKGDTPTGWAWMYDLEDWNILIAFGLIFLGLIVAAHKSTPLGRGRGVVVGMLGCFLIGLAWIVVYYFTSTPNADIPVITALGQWNLVVGIGFMATGFVYATKWE